MRFEIHSRKLDCTFRFFALDEGGRSRNGKIDYYGGYIYLEGTTPDRLGTLGGQITDRKGNCLDCRSFTPNDAKLNFERIARNYVRNCVRKA